MRLDPDELRARVTALLAANRVEEGAVRYTRPAAKTYPHQWLWDSCFHAHVHSLLGDAKAARAELRALFRAQCVDGPDRGRLPHMTFIGAAARQLGVGEEQAAEAQTRDAALWGNPVASTITQPPIVADAVRTVGDRAFWRELWPGLTAYYDWWLRRRDPDGDGLCAIWHLWESGADATPRGDAACARLLATGRVPRHLDKGTHNPTARKREELVRARFLMLEELQALDGAELSGALDEVEAQRRRRALLGLEAVDLQAHLVRNLGDLAFIGDALGELRAAERYRAAANRIVEAVNATLWDEARGGYFDRWGAARERLPLWTYAPFVALYAGELVPRSRAERLLARLVDPAHFWTRWPLPTVARSEPTFDPDEYWRGSTWLNVNWLVARGLVETAERLADARYLPPARAIVDRSLELVARTGFREYYRSGAATPSGDGACEPAAFGPESFSWSGLALALLALAEGALADVDPAP